MRDALRRFEERAPEIVFEWSDAPTGARGWVVINSLHVVAPLVEERVCARASIAAKWKASPRPWR